MFTKRTLLAVLVAGAVMLAVGVGPEAQAFPRAQQPDLPGATIPYPGQLNDDAGRAVADGDYDFTFTLYDAPTGGEPLWSEVQEGVAVKGGDFVATLGSVAPIPANVLMGGERWLEVEVRGPGEADFTLLTPRQRLSANSSAAPASPSAGPTCPHDHWGETWSGSGIGMTLELDSGGSTASLISVLSAVYGNHDVFYGVLGQSNGSGIGVGGISVDKYGVYGASTNSYGGYFSSDNDHLDLALGGDVGRVNSDPEKENSQLYLSSNADMILKLDNDGGENHTLRVKDSNGTDACTISEGGDLACTGTKSAAVETADHDRRLLYAVESPEVWFEDFGSASLTDGEVRVAIEPVFAATVNLNEEYHVFVTPVCQEPVLLFVTDKDATGFTVRGVTLDGQPSRCSFDYRIVAKRLGYEGLRLEKAAWQEGGDE